MNFFLEVNNRNVAQGCALFVKGGQDSLNTTPGEYTGIAFGYGAGDTYNNSAIIHEFVNTSAAAKLHLCLETGTGQGTADISDAKLTVDSSGKIGINKTDPTEFLEVNGRIRGIASVGTIQLTQHYTMTQSGTYTVPFGQLTRGDSADFAFDSSNKGLLIKKTGWYYLALTENWDTASVNGRVDITFVAVGQTNPGSTIFNTDTTTYDQKEYHCTYEVTSPNTIIYVTYSTGYTTSNFYHGCGKFTAIRLN